MNSKLGDCTYYVNERISIADFFLTAVLKCHFGYITAEESVKYMNILRYINTIEA